MYLSKILTKNKKNIIIKKQNTRSCLEDCIIFLIANVDLTTFTINTEKSSPCFKKIYRVEFCMLKNETIYSVFKNTENTTYCVLF